MIGLAAGCNTLDAEFGFRAAASSPRSGSRLGPELAIASLSPMAWSPLSRWQRRSLSTGRLATRASALLDRVRKHGVAPSALVLALRAANKLAQSLSEQKNPHPTPSQRRALLAAAAQIRQLAAGIIVTAEKADPQSVEFALAELISGTLALIERVTAEPLTIDTHEVPPEARLKR